MEMLTKALISEQQIQLSGSDDAQTAATLIPKHDNELESSKSECKTPTPVDKTEEKQRNMVPDRSKVAKSLEKLNLEEEKQRISMDRSKVPNSPAKMNLECKTPTQKMKIGGIEFPKNGTPNRLKLPIAFKYPERYTSPTDLMISPISKGILARTRKGALPSKMHELRNPKMSVLYQS